MAGLAHRSFSSGLFHFRREVCILPACAFRWRSFEMEFKVTVRAAYLQHLNLIYYGEEHFEEEEISMLRPDAQVENVETDRRPGGAACYMPLRAQ